MPDDILFQATILGKCQSKANARIRTKWGGVIKSAAAREFCKAFLLQIAQFKRPPQCPYTLDVALYATIYYQSRRNDLDESLLMDLLQCGTPKNPGAGIIQNDRAIKYKEITWGLDPSNPRVEFLLKPYSVPGSRSQQERLKLPEPSFPNLIAQDITQLKQVYSQRQSIA